MGGHLRHRLRLLLWSIASVPLTGISLSFAIFTVVDVGLIAVWVGIPLLVWDVTVTRRLANLHRRYAGGLLGVHIERPYLRKRDGSLLARMRSAAADPATRRDVWWLWANGTAGMALSILAVVESVFGLLLWWIPPGFFLKLQARLAAALLGPTEKSRLALRVQQLTESRAETVDTQAAELRRIERDLHDGAQARLVALGMSLALAEQQLARDPELARELLGEARTASSTALAELRDLVRGIHPPVLADRGLVGAVQALALASPVPVEVDAAVPQRLPAPVESAAYFVTAEALTNVIKHASATSARITITHADELLTVRVRDDGRGGADPSGGTGLRGIERRLSAFDGVLAVESPRGGPTELVMVLPCVSSSPKTSPSSETA